MNRGRQLTCQYETEILRKRWRVLGLNHRKGLYGQGCIFLLLKPVEREESWTVTETMELKCQSKSHKRRWD